MFSIFPMAFLDIFRDLPFLQLEIWKLFFIAVLLFWVLIDLIDIYYFPQYFLKKEMKEMRESSQERIEKEINQCLADFPLTEFSVELQKLPNFQGLRELIKKELSKPREELRKKHLFPIYEKYSKEVPQILFKGLNPPQCEEDLAMIEYKINHKERELDFTFHQLKAKLRKSLAQDLVPFIEDILEDQQKQVELVRKAIQKDQDTLPILGMEIPLEKAAQIIINSGGVFNVNGIRPKSLSVIAGTAPAKHWDIFCRLIWNTSSLQTSKTENFLEIFSLEVAKGESVPYDFLKFAAKWLERNSPDLTTRQVKTVDHSLDKLKPLESLSQVGQMVFQDDEARSILDTLKKEHMSSREKALAYLNLSQKANEESIKKEIGVKRKNLNQNLSFVKREKRKKVLVEIHFLKHDLQKYLLPGGA